MAKEWILNSAMNRFQLNFKKNVGAVAAEIRLCSPKSVEEWRIYYYEKVKSENHIENLGRKLYIKVTEVIQSEVAKISEQDCINYMKQLVIDRTYDGYMTEIQTVYGQLQAKLSRKILAAPDEWDRLYNVDFYIKVGEKFIGIQIKPVKQGIQIPEIYKEYNLQDKTHKKVKANFGGRVFYVFSQKTDGKKTIANPDIICEILKEINDLETNQR